MNTKRKLHLVNEFLESSFGISLSGVKFNTSKDGHTTLDELELISGLLKRRGYSKYGNLFTKDFVAVVVEISDLRSITKITIKHDITNSSECVITESFITGLNIYLTNFERL
jgi:hypothetical protein